MIRWNFARRIGTVALAAALAASASLTAFAEGPGSGASQTSQTVQANVINTAAAEKPEVACEGAALYDATHGVFLFEKNGDRQFYPASITKVMTALLAVENLNMDSTVTFSKSAVTNLETAAVTLQVQEGETFAVRDLMYGLWLKSANEIANGLAEAVAGSVPAFADLMNQKAASLGCTHTNFVNPNGLNNANHLTTAKDMALITAAAFSNSQVRQIAQTLHYNFPASPSVPETRYLTMGHKMLNPGNSQYYEGFIGGKTGYTSKAGNTLVSVAERGGVRLVAVVLKSSATHYADTKKMFDYGFAVTGAGNAAVSTAQAAAETAAAETAAAETEAAAEPKPEAGSVPVTVTEGPGSEGAQTAETVQAIPQEIAQAEETAQAGETAGSGSADVSPAGTGWVETDGGWKYRKADGSWAKDEELLVKEKYYIFGSDEMMLRGWNYARGSWRYYGSNGDMKRSRWVETNGMWYYVTEEGSLLVNGTTPDGYRVDANGVWIQ